MGALLLLRGWGLACFLRTQKIRHVLPKSLNHHAFAHTHAQWGSMVPPTAAHPVLSLLALLVQKYKR